MNTRTFLPIRTLTRLALALPLVAGSVAYSVGGAVPFRVIVQDPVRTAEVMPAFPGGNEALTAYMVANVTYPAAAKQAGAQGTVHVHFVVNADGTLRDVKVPRPVNPELEAEAIRVVQAMPDWTPGKQGGVAIPVLMTLPVSFKLDGK